MTEGPPQSEAAASFATKSASSSNAPAHQPTSDTDLSGTSSTHLQSNPYFSHSALNGSWPYNNSGYVNFVASSSVPSGSYTHANQSLTAYAPYQHSYSSVAPTNNANLQPLKSEGKHGTSSQANAPTTLLPDPRTYKHWEEALKNFLRKMKMFQSLKGMENDFLVLNSDWEQKNLPRALAELIQHLQVRSALG